MFLHLIVKTIDENYKFITMDPK